MQPPPIYLRLHGDGSTQDVDSRDGGSFGEPLNVAKEGVVACLKSTEVLRIETDGRTTSLEEHRCCRCEVTL